MLLLPVIAGIVASIVASEQNVDGFQDTRWGMSESQVQELYGGKLERWTSTTKGLKGVVPQKTFPHFGLRHYDIDGCDFYVDFRFQETRLSEVLLGLNDELKIECPRKIVDVLIGKYGLPAEYEQHYSTISRDHDRRWYLGSTKILQLDNSYEAIGTHPAHTLLYIYYRPTQTSGAKKL